ncbi:response regulator [Paenibacillaceae bacterium WGS1546]|uniref:response regulator n=1 Tax=Cohnella sp. WGS1546 TaxID=3366810 RepID=UPI00372CF883
METLLRILVADDHPLFREGVRNVVNNAEGMTVVGEAATGEEAVELALELRPDVILMDIRMPGLNGIEATARIRSAHDGIRVLMLTMFKDDDSVITGMKAGASGYILKDADKEDIVLAIRVVAAGEAIFGGDIASRLIAYATRPASRLDQFPELTYREKEVLHLMVEGYANSDISRKLELSSKTVSNYVSAILNKLRAPDRASAIHIVKQSRPDNP